MEKKGLAAVVTGEEPTLKTFMLIMMLFILMIVHAEPFTELLSTTIWTTMSTLQISANTSDGLKAF